jgi:membrane protease YdiL (CAAX protease family)
VASGGAGGPFGAGPAPLLRARGRGPQILTAPPGPPEVAPAPAARYFSPWATALFAALTALLVGFFYWSWGSPLDNLERPEESLERLVAREMDLQAVMDDIPRWEMTLYRLTGSDPETFEDAIGRFDELDEEQRSARADVDIVVLLAESGQLERAAAIIEALQSTDTAAAQYGQWLDAAYLEAPSPQDATAMAEEIRRELPRDWFTDTLVRRIATRVDDPALQADAEASIEARGRTLLRRVRALTLTGVGLLLLALALLWLLPRSPRGARVAGAPLPPRWRGGDGLGLFFRATFAYLLMPAALVLLLPRTPGTTVAMGLLGGAPMLWWLRRYLHARGESIRETFGLRVTHGHALRVIGWSVVLLGISLAGESLLSIGLTALGVTSHWADGFLEEFLWGSPTTVMAGTIDGVVWAPVFEELAFRGLLYPTLRLRLPPWPAALLSAALFGVAHGYGLQGFAAVTWSGMVWALGYERTRSLLPGILAHAASNLLATTGFLLLLRF